MASGFGHSAQPGLEAAERALKAAVQTWNFEPSASAIMRPTRAFVTVSRQPGAGAISFSHRLAERLRSEGQEDWRAWDRELIEKVSQESGISTDVIESIPEHSHNWFVKFLDGLSANASPPELLESRA